MDANTELGVPGSDNLRIGGKQIQQGLSRSLGSWSVNG